VQKHFSWVHFSGQKYQKNENFVKCSSKTYKIFSRSLFSILEALLWRLRNTTFFRLRDKPRVILLRARPLIMRGLNRSVVQKRLPTPDLKQIKKGKKTVHITSWFIEESNFFDCTDKNGIKPISSSLGRRKNGGRGPWPLLDFEIWYFATNF